MGRSNMSVYSKYTDNNWHPRFPGNWPGSSGGGLAFSTTSLPDATIGVPYAAQLQVAGGSGNYNIWMESGYPHDDLWLTCDSAGNLSGVSQMTWIDTFTFFVVDLNTNQTAQVTLSLRSVATGALAWVTAAALPAATLNGFYNARILVKGGVPPYSHVQTSLVQGYTLTKRGWVLASPNASLPSGSGTITFTDTVTDSAGTQISQSFTIAQNAAALTIGGVDAVHNLIHVPHARAGHKYKSQPILPYGVSGGTTYYTLSGSLPPGISVNLGSAGTLTKLKKWYNGHWALTYGQPVRLNDTYAGSTQYYEINNFAGPNSVANGGPIVGYLFNIAWGGCEGATPGSWMFGGGANSTYFIDQAVADCKKYGLKFAFAFDPNVPNAGTPEVPNGPGYLPNYILTTSTYGAGLVAGSGLTANPSYPYGFWVQQTGGYCANLSNANVQARMQALFNQLATVFDSDPAFDGIQAWAWDNMQPFTASLSDANYFNLGLKPQINAMLSAFKQSNIMQLAGWDSTNGGNAENYMAYCVQNGVIPSSSDMGSYAQWQATFLNLGSGQSGTSGFTSAPLSGATSATLASAWNWQSAPYSVKFSNGDVRTVTLTNGSTTADWSSSGGLSSNCPNASATFAPAPYSKSFGIQAYMGIVVQGSGYTLPNPALNSLITSAPQVEGGDLVPSAGGAPGDQGGNGLDPASIIQAANDPTKYNAGRVYWVIFQNTAQMGANPITAALFTNLIPVLKNNPLVNTQYPAQSLTNYWSGSGTPTAGDATISGTPTTPGTYDFNLQAFNGSSQSTIVKCRMVVRSTKQVSRPSYNSNPADGPFVLNGELYDANGFIIETRGYDRLHYDQGDWTGGAQGAAAGVNLCRWWIRGNTASDPGEQLNQFLNNQILGSMTLSYDPTSGGGSTNSNNTTTLNNIFAWWAANIATLLPSAATKQAALVDFANEWGKTVTVNSGNDGGNSNLDGPAITEANWVSLYSAGITSLRNAGYNGPVIVETLNNAQDHVAVSGGYAAQILAADPKKNVIFAYHPYGTKDYCAQIASVQTGTSTVITLNSNLPYHPFSPGYPGNPNNYTAQSSYYIQGAQGMPQLNGTQLTNNNNIGGVQGAWTITLNNVNSQGWGSGYVANSATIVVEADPNNNSGAYGGSHYDREAALLASWKANGICVMALEVGPMPLNGTASEWSDIASSFESRGVWFNYWAWDDHDQGNLQQTSWPPGQWYGLAGPTGTNYSGGQYVPSDPTSLTANGLQVITHPRIGVLHLAVKASQLL
ncbi:MAG: hypothetical protein KGL39_24645 [Patescibacteria group bacterium]|nr:hypothetical protein [Patescibacteria group bacterium]